MYIQTKNCLLAVLLFSSRALPIVRHDLRGPTTTTTLNSYYVIETTKAGDRRLPPDSMIGNFRRKAKTHELRGLLAEPAGLLAALPKGLQSSLSQFAY